MKNKICRSGYGKLSYLSRIFVTGVLSCLVSISANAANEKAPILNFNDRIFPEIATKGMVATQEARATEVGVSILRQGGNAVDAAVAVGFALAVTLPRAGNLGGGGFMMIYDKQSGKVRSLDYREKAPKAAYSQMFLDKSLDVDKNKARYSVFSAGVPGTVAGMLEAHRKYGKLPLKTLIEPAVKLAQNLPMSFAMAESLNRKKRYLSRSKESIRNYYKADGSEWTIYDTLKQENLARVLQAIADTNGESFYHGDTAEKLVRFIQSKGGLMTLEDFKSYQPVWREPLSANFGDATIYSMPPPSSGGIHLVQLLNIIQEFPIKKAGPNSEYSVHMMTEAMKFAYADRSKYLGDPDFVTIPVEKLTSTDYAKKIASKISIDKVLKSKDVLPGMYISQESPQTTHYSVVDKDGNMVSNTYTLNFSFGSGITVPETGILLNNEMDDFSAKPGVPNGYGLLGGEANSIQPEKRPLSSMTPVLVLDKGNPWLATGSPGGSRIITIVYNVLMNRMVHDMNIASATLAPRIHHQWYPELLMLEKGFPVDTAERLKEKGHNIRFFNSWGSVQSVEVGNGVFFGFADTRRPGAKAKGINKIDKE
ncbi:MAG: gamma-glutamyltransferase [Kangiellaceae bacterium]